MSLNNQITTKKFEKEKMDDEQNKVKGQQEEETAAIDLGDIEELQDVLDLDRSQGRREERRNFL